MHIEEVLSKMAVVQEKLAVVEKLMIQKDAERVSILKAWKDEAMQIQFENSELNEDLNILRSISKLTDEEREKIGALFVKSKK